MTEQSAAERDLRAENARLAAENANLREVVTSSHALLAEITRLEAETARLRAQLDSGATEIATQWGVLVRPYPVRKAAGETQARADLATIRHANPGALLVERTVHYGPWHATETAEETAK